MLKELYIENLAVIEKANISFCGKLNVFTGETGAGKSILIGGINAVLGERVYKDIVRSGADKAVVSVLFDKIPEKTSNILKEYGFAGEDDNELLLSREISADGKSTARVNGKTATAAVLKEIASELIDIHGQHDNRILMSTEHQREILDSYGRLEKKLSEYAESFKNFSTISKKIKKLESESQYKNAKLEILNEKINDIKSYNLIKGEEETISAELNALRNSAVLEQTLNRVYSAFSGDDDINGIANLLQSAEKDLSEISGFLPECKNLVERISGLIIEADDIRSELSPLIPDENDTARLPSLEERMSDILKLKRKYDMDIDELIEEYENWQNEFAELQYSDNEAEKLLQEKKRLGDKVRSLANELTLLRKEAAEKLVKQITDELVYLDMPDIKLVFDIRQDKVTITGMDSVNILISVNKGEEPKPINKIASGGELSRIMLAIKSVLAENDDIPTMIFDEIDTGISGRAAHKVGVKLSEIAEKRQVLCVTHLAQIAAMADAHLMIEKDSDGERTYTTVGTLNYEERKKELARIISGNPDNEISLRNAEELLKRNTE